MNATTLGDRLAPKCVSRHGAGVYRACDWRFNAIADNDNTRMNMPTSALPAMYRQGVQP